LWGSAYCLHSHAQSGSRYRPSPIDRMTLITWGEYAVCDARWTKLRVYREVCGPSCAQATGERCRYAHSMYEFFFAMHDCNALRNCNSSAPGGLCAGAAAPHLALNSVQACSEFLIFFRYRLNAEATTPAAPYAITYARHDPASNSRSPRRRPSTQVRNILFYFCFPLIFVLPAVVYRFIRCEVCSAYHYYCRHVNCDLKRRVIARFFFNFFCTSVVLLTQRL
jgi:hypothetical protein